jgi:DNA-binding CsgD family transcriptional regulator
VACMAQLQQLLHAFAPAGVPPRAGLPLPSTGRLLPAVRSAVPAEPHTAELPAAGVSPAVLQALGQLSAREREVLGLLLANYRTRSIARTLFISPHTVRNHLKAIFDKLGVHSQIELLERLGQYR